MINMDATESIKEFELRSDTKTDLPKSPIKIDHNYSKSPSMDQNYPSIDKETNQSNNDPMMGCNDLSSIESKTNQDDNDLTSTTIDQNYHFIDTKTSDSHGPTVSRMGQNDPPAIEPKTSKGHNDPAVPTMNCNDPPSIEPKTNQEHDSSGSRIEQNDPTSAESKTINHDSKSSDSEIKSPETVSSENKPIGVLRVINIELLKKSTSTNKNSDTSQSGSKNVLEIGPEILYSLSSNLSDTTKAKRSVYSESKSEITSSTAPKLDAAESESTINDPKSSISEKSPDTAIKSFDSNSSNSEIKSPESSENKPMGVLRLKNIELLKDPTNHYKLLKSPTYQNSVSSQSELDVLRVEPGALDTPLSSNIEINEKQSFNATKERRRETTGNSVPVAALTLEAEYISDRNGGLIVLKVNTTSNFVNTDSNSNSNYVENENSVNLIDNSNSKFGKVTADLEKDQIDDILEISDSDDEATAKSKPTSDKVIDLDKEESEITSDVITTVNIDAAKEKNRQDECQSLFLKEVTSEDSQKADEESRLNSDKTVQSLQEFYESQSLLLKEVTSEDSQAVDNNEESQLNSDKDVQSQLNTCNNARQQNIQASNSKGEAYRCGYYGRFAIEFLKRPILHKKTWRKWELPDRDKELMELGKSLIGGCTPKVVQKRICSFRRFCVAKVRRYVHLNLHEENPKPLEPEWLREIEKKWYLVNIDNELKGLPKTTHRTVNTSNVKLCELIPKIIKLAHERKKIPDSEIFSSFSTMYKMTPDAIQENWDQAVCKAKQWLAMYCRNNDGKHNGKCRMAKYHWAIIDFLLVYDSSTVIMIQPFYGMKPLRWLLENAPKYEVDSKHLTPEELKQRWTKLYNKYLELGKVYLSPLCLQRRWYEFKRNASQTAGIESKKTKKSLTDLYKELIKACPYIITERQMSWESMLENDKVFMINKNSLNPDYAVGVLPRDDEDDDEPKLVIDEEVDHEQNFDDKNIDDANTTGKKVLKGNNKEKKRKMRRKKPVKQLEEITPSYNITNFKTCNKNKKSTNSKIDDSKSGKEIMETNNTVDLCLGDDESQLVIDDQVSDGKTPVIEVKGDIELLSADKVKDDETSLVIDEKTVSVEEASLVGEKASVVPDKIGISTYFGFDDDEDDEDNTPLVYDSDDETSLVIDDKRSDDETPLVIDEEKSVINDKIVPNEPTSGLDDDVEHNYTSSIHNDKMHGDDQASLVIYEKVQDSNTPDTPLVYDDKTDSKVQASLVIDDKKSDDKTSLVIDEESSVINDKIIPNETTLGLSDDVEHNYTSLSHNDKISDDKVSSIIDEKVEDNDTPLVIDDKISNDKTVVTNDIISDEVSLVIDKKVEDNDTPLVFADNIESDEQASLVIDDLTSNDKTLVLDDKFSDDEVSLVIDDKSENYSEMIKDKIEDDKTNLVTDDECSDETPLVIDDKNETDEIKSDIESKKLLKVNIHTDRSTIDDIKERSLKNKVMEREKVGIISNIEVEKKKNACEKLDDELNKLLYDKDESKQRIVDKKTGYGLNKSAKLKIFEKRNEKIYMNDGVTSRRSRVRKKPVKVNEIRSHRSGVRLEPVKLNDEVTILRPGVRKKPARVNDEVTLHRSGEKPVRLTDVSLGGDDDFICEGNDNIGSVEKDNVITNLNSDVSESNMKLSPCIEINENTRPLSVSLADDNDFICESNDNIESVEKDNDIINLNSEVSESNMKLSTCIEINHNTEPLRVLQNLDPSQVEATILFDDSDDEQVVDTCHGITSQEYSKKNNNNSNINITTSNNSQYNTIEERVGDIEESDQNYINERKSVDNNERNDTRESSKSCDGSTSSPSDNDDDIQIANIKKEMVNSLNSENTKDDDTILAAKVKQEIDEENSYYSNDKSNTNTVLKINNKITENDDYLNIKQEDVNNSNNENLNTENLETANTLNNVNKVYLEPRDFQGLNVNENKTVIKNELNDINSNESNENLDVNYATLKDFLNKNDTDKVLDFIHKGKEITYDNHLELFKSIDERENNEKSNTDPQNLIKIKDFISKSDIDVLLDVIYATKNKSPKKASNLNVNINEIKEECNKIDTNVKSEIIESKDESNEINARSNSPIVIDDEIPNSITPKTLRECLRFDTDHLLDMIDKKKSIKQYGNIKRSLLKELLEKPIRYPCLPKDLVVTSNSGSNKKSGYFNDKNTKRIKKKIQKRKEYGIFCDLPEDSADFSETESSTDEDYMDTSYSEDSDQSGTIEIDQKLLQTTSVYLKRIDDSPTWKAHSKLDSIDINKFEQNELKPKNRKIQNAKRRNPDYEVINSGIILKTRKRRRNMKYKFSDDPVDPDDLKKSVNEDPFRTDDSETEYFPSKKTRDRLNKIRMEKECKELNENRKSLTYKICEVTDGTVEMRMEEKIPVKETENDHNKVYDRQERDNVINEKQTPICGKVKDMMKHCKDLKVVLNKIQSPDDKQGNQELIRKVQLPDKTSMMKKKTPTAHVVPITQRRQSAHARKTAGNKGIGSVQQSGKILQDSRTSTEQLSTTNNGYDEWIRQKNITKRFFNFTEDDAERSKIYKNNQKSSAKAPPSLLLKLNESTKPNSPNILHLIAVTNTQNPSPNTTLNSTTSSPNVKPPNIKLNASQSSPNILPSMQINSNVICSVNTQGSSSPNVSPICNNSNMQSNVSNTIPNTNLKPTQDVSNTKTTSGTNLKPTTQVSNTKTNSKSIIQLNTLFEHHGLEIIEKDTSNNKCIKLIPRSKSTDSINKKKEVENVEGKTDNAIKNVRHIDKNRSVSAETTTAHCNRKHKKIEVRNKDKKDCTGLKMEVGPIKKENNMTYKVVYRKIAPKTNTDDSGCNNQGDKQAIKTEAMKTEDNSNIVKNEVRKKHINKVNSTNESQEIQGDDNIIKDHNVNSETIEVQPKDINNRRKIVDTMKVPVNNLTPVKLMKFEKGDGRIDVEIPQKHMIKNVLSMDKSNNDISTTIGNSDSTNSQAPVQREVIQKSTTNDNIVNKPINKHITKTNSKTVKQHIPKINNEKPNVTDTLNTKKVELENNDIKAKTEELNIIDITVDDDEPVPVKNQKEVEERRTTKRKLNEEEKGGEKKQRPANRDMKTPVNITWSKIKAETYVKERNTAEIVLICFDAVKSLIKFSHNKVILTEKNIVSLFKMPVYLTVAPLAEAKVIEIADNVESNAINISNRWYKKISLKPLCYARIFYAVSYYELIKKMSTSDCHIYFTYDIQTGKIDAAKINLNRLTKEDRTDKIIQPDLITHPNSLFRVNNFNQNPKDIEIEDTTSNVSNVSQIIPESTQNVSQINPNPLSLLAPNATQNISQINSNPLYQITPNAQNMAYIVTPILSSDATNISQIDPTIQNVCSNPLSLLAPNTSQNTSHNITLLTPNAIQSISPPKAHIDLSNINLNSLNTNLDTNNLIGLKITKNYEKNDHLIGLGKTKNDNTNQKTKKYDESVNLLRGQKIVISSDDDDDSTPLEQNGVKSTLSNFARALVPKKLRANVGSQPESGPSKVRESDSTHQDLRKLTTIFPTLTVKAETFVGQYDRYQISLICFDAIRPLLTLGENIVLVTERSHVPVVRVPVYLSIAQLNESRVIELSEDYDLPEFKLNDYWYKKLCPKPLCYARVFFAVSLKSTMKKLSKPNYKIYTYNIKTGYIGAARLNDYKVQLVSNTQNILKQDIATHPNILYDNDICPLMAIDSSQNVSYLFPNTSSLLAPNATQNVSHVTPNATQNISHVAPNHLSLLAPSTTQNDPNPLSLSAPNATQNVSHGAPNPLPFLAPNATQNDPNTSQSTPVAHIDLSNLNLVNPDININSQSTNGSYIGVNLSGVNVAGPFYVVDRNMKPIDPKSISCLLMNKDGDTGTVLAGIMNQPESPCNSLLVPNVGNALDPKIVKVESQCMTSNVGNQHGGPSNSLLVPNVGDTLHSRALTSNVGNQRGSPTNSLSVPNIALDPKIVKVESCNNEVIILDSDDD